MKNFKIILPLLAVLIAAVAVWAGKNSPSDNATQEKAAFTNYYWLKVQYDATGDSCAILLPTTQFVPNNTQPVEDNPFDCPDEGTLCCAYGYSEAQMQIVPGSNPQRLEVKPTEISNPDIIIYEEETKL